MYSGKTILVTGGTGSWGHELVKKLLTQNPKEIRIFSRGELAQVTMEREFQDERLKFIIGDIRCYEALERALKNVDYVFHLAALKHVPICEVQPEEAIKTNIKGTENLIKACIINKVKKVIDVSTDKAVDALNLYGMTKAVGERLFIQANMLSDTTDFVCIRAGNVLGSNGSVVPFFIQCIEKDQSISVTSKKMTRYFITLPEAIELLLKAASLSIGGEIIVMKMPSYRIIDIAHVLIEESGKQHINIVETGIRPGEKLNEVLISEYESGHTYQLDENYYVILPQIELKKVKKYYYELGLSKVKFSKYSSADNVLDIQCARVLLFKGGFL